VAFSFFITNTVWAAPQLGLNQPVNTSQKSQPDFTLDLSASLGSIDEVFAGRSSSQPLYFIQDAHTSLEAQENIAKIIEQLVREKNIRTVYVEGYEGEVPLDGIFSWISDTQAKQKISYFLMDYLRLNGARFAYINRKQDFRLIGIESLPDYLDNLTAYRDAAQNRERLAKDLNRISKKLKALGSRLYSKEIKEYQKLKGRFEEKKISLANYLFRLMKISAKGDKSEGTGDSERYSHLRLVSDNLHKNKLSSKESEELNAKLKVIDAHIFF